MTSNSDIQKNGVYAPGVLEFVRIANDYCLWLEDAAADEGMKFISKGVKSLSAVYNAVLELEETEPVLEGGNEKFVTEQDWSEIYQRISLILGQYNSYLRLAESDEFDRSDLVTHTISEDLADIYQDLKDFTRQFRQGIEEIMNDAVWEVLSNFDQYWGSKLLNALSALHVLYVNKTDPEQGDEGGMQEGETGNAPGYDTSLFTKLQDSNEEEL